MRVPLHAVFRFDATPEIGGGHAIRCLALAEVLAAEGWRITFAGVAQTLDVAPALCRSQYHFAKLDAADDPTALKSAVFGSVNLLVVDHYGQHKAYEAACRSFARKILVIDDLADRDHECDFLLDPTFGRDPMSYRRHLPGDARLAIGPDYALLRSSFAEVRTGGIVRRTDVHRIYLSMGMTDPSRSIVPMLQALSRYRVDVDVVVGPSASDLPAIRETADLCGARVHVDPLDVAGLMANADLAILAAGATTWEGACVGLPMILMVKAGNQSSIARAMQQAGAGLVAETNEDAANLVGQLIEDRAKRESLARAAARICDGLGSRRVAIMLRPEQSDDGRAITLRPISSTDAELIYVWQSHPKSRRYARNPAVPTMREHLGWLAGKLDDPNSSMHIVLYGDVAAGLLRLDRAGAAGLEVSILIDPAYHQRGIGAAALRLARRLMPQSTILAYVLPGNLVSRRLFEKAGYQPSETNWFIQKPTANVAVPA